MTPEPRETPNALTADPEATAVDRPRLAVDGERAGRAEELLEAGTSHQRALFLLLEHPCGFRDELAVLPRRYGGPDVELELHGAPVRAVRRLAPHLGLDGRLDRITGEVQAPVPEGFDQLEGQRAGAQHAGPT